MNNPITNAALAKAAEAARMQACKPGCCGEGTGCEVGPCHCSRVAAAAAVAAFLRTLHENGLTALAEGNLPCLADYVLAAAKDERE
jgi:hypothetical protein